MWSFYMGVTSARGSLGQAEMWKQPELAQGGTGASIKYVIIDQRMTVHLHRHVIDLARAISNPPWMRHRERESSEYENNSEQDEP